MASNGKRPSGVPTALLYTRVSSDEQAREGLSLPAQLADVRRYAANLGWTLGSEYQDVLSGKRDDRPQYQALLTEVQRLRAEGKDVAVVVKWLDRFGRSVLERARSAKELRQAGVPIHSVMEGGLVSDFVYNILAAVAEEEVRRLGERVAEVRQHAKQSGWKFPGRTAWGYRWRPATEAERGAGAPQVVLDEDPERAPYYREAVRRALDGPSVRAVAAWVQSLPDEVRGGRRMNTPCVLKMLRAPVYIARPDDGDDDVLRRPVGRWPALVDDATWARLQERIASHNHMPHQASRKYLLTGLIRCPVCGTRMQGRWCKNNNGKYYPSYVCHGESRGAGAKRLMCQWAAALNPVENAVLAEVSKILDAVTGGDDLQGRLQRAWQRLTEPADAPDVNQRRRQLEREVERARERLKSAALKLVDGELDREGYVLVREQATRDLEGAEAELTRLAVPTPDETLPDLETVLGLADEWAEVLAEPDLPERREVLGLLIDYVVPVRHSRNNYGVEVHWTPTGEALGMLAANLRASDNVLVGYFGQPKYSTSTRIAGLRSAARR